MKLTTEEIARIVHEQNRAYQYILQDTNPSQPWDSEQEWIRNALMHAVELVREGANEAEIQQFWVDSRHDLGWELGEDKNYESVPPTHPNLVPFEKLPEDEKRKARATVALVKIYSS